MNYKIIKPVRLIELFSGVGSQLMAMKRLGVECESWKTSDWEINSVASYKAIHHSDDNTDYSEGLNKEQLVNELFKLGISTDGKKPLELKQIAHKGEKWLRQVYNNFKASHNLGSILNIHAEDLEIIDQDKYKYLMTYSFPCQDLSVAGRQAGMSKGSGTRSGLLWEVERLLFECKEQNCLPDVLLLENVTQVHGKKNLDDWNNWLKSLENMGYKTYWSDLNSKNYGVAQNRNRCFAVSLLSDLPYQFPESIPLQKRLNDYLEDEVDEKYYINTPKAEKLINELIERGVLPNDKEKTTVDFTINQPGEREVANAVVARVDCGISNQRSFGTGIIQDEEIKK